MFKLIVNIPLITQEFYSILYTALILFLVKDDRKYKLLDNKLFNYLGKITYGTYVYHLMIVFMVAYYCKKYNYMNPNFMYVITIILSFGIAAISYEFMEKRIYKIRNRFLN
jgi:peptidoglycan/LPS O-acetylase OafA/YrhL